MAAKSTNNTTIKWNPYNIGDLRRQVSGELKKVATNKDYRNAKGLESGTLKEYKGNDHWALYIEIELLEYITKRVDELFKNTFIPTLTAVKDAEARVVSLQSQVKSLETSLPKKLTPKQDEILKNLKQDTIRLQRLKEDMESLVPAFNTQATEIRNDVKKGVKLLRMALEKDINTMKQEIITTMQGSTNIFQESMQESTKEVLGGLKELETKVGSVHAMVDVLKDDQAATDKGIKISMKTVQESLENFGVKIEWSSKRNEELMESLGTQLAEMGEAVSQTSSQVGERMETYQATVTTILEDYQKAQVTELKEAADGLARSLEEQSEEVRNVLMERLDRLDETHKKELAREVGELRVSLSSIRSDIELMKTVLTKISK